MKRKICGSQRRWDRSSGTGKTAILSAAETGIKLDKLSFNELYEREREN